MENLIRELMVKRNRYFEINTTVTTRYSHRAKLFTIRSTALLKGHDVFLSPFVLIQFGFGKEIGRGILIREWIVI